MSAVPIIWALLDDKPGHKNQVLGVAEALGLPFLTKKLSYTTQAKKPNFWPISVHKRLKNAEILTPPWPNLVLSAGRRTSPIARWIKHQHSATSVVHLMHPGWPYGHIDLLVLPQHDIPKGNTKINQKKGTLSLLGAPHRITQAVLQDQLAIWQQSLPKLQTPVLTVLIGGNTAHGKMVMSDIQALSDYIAAHKGSVLLSVSRRTPEAVKQALETVINSKKNSMYYCPMAQAQRNPYFAFLAAADELCVTSDSVSMLSEAASTDAPLRIVYLPHLMRPKHQYFVQALIAKNYATEWGNSGTTHPLPNPAQIIAKEILDYVRLAD